ncbi:MAG: HDOD domain-containing protein [Desulfuromonadaceae bacterium]|nr:HDOD domain-containing protein [Desulfuromonas sp.]MDY0185183.1 HDOD domain-containing protein [Desulfuromonadaceae bacterium]
MTNSLYDNLKLEIQPTIPHTLLELIKLSTHPIVEIEDLAHIIRQDPIVCARIFSLANSVYFRQWNKISDVLQLLVVIGIEPVFQIALLCATEQIFTHLNKQLEVPVTILWYRSVLCANIAEEMAALTGCEPRHEVYLAGLLHRIGQWTLLSNFPQRYLEEIDVTLELKRAEKIEHGLFKATSSEIGARIIQDLQIAQQICPFIADAIKFQTLPTDSLLEGTPLVRILALSSILCDTQNVQSAEVIYAASRLFGLNSDIIQQVTERARKQTDSVISRFSPQNEEGLSESGPELLMKSQTQQQRSLRLQVKNHALVNAGRIPPANYAGRKKIFNQLRLNFNLLFGMPDLCFLLVENTSNSLYGYDDLGIRPELHQISISFGNETSMILKALQEDKAYYSPEEQKNIFSLPERQLKNLLGCKSLCFVPIRSGPHKKGIIVTPMSPNQWQQFSTAPSLLQLAGRVAGAALSVVDEQLRYQELERDELAYNLRATAHEINNPLSIINNYLFLLLQQLDTEKAREQIKIIQEEIGRIGILVSGLEDIHAVEKGQKRSHIQINELIDTLYTLLYSTLFKPRQLKLNVDLDAELKPIASVGSNVKQILMNLLKNAAEALPPQGEVWLTTRDRVYKNRRQYVEIEVRDNGPGIDNEILADIFKPVRSTKQGHSGLGLSIVKHLLDEIDGEISCSSSEAGTRFQIFLPRVLA